MTIELGDDLKNWRKSKKTAPSLLAADIAEKHLVYKHALVQDAISLHQAQIQVHKAYMTNPVNSKAVGFVANPTGVCALQHFAVGALVLKPYGSLYPVKDKEKEKPKLMIGSFGMNPPKMVTEFEKVDDKCVLVPFWYVKSTMDEELVNVALEEKQVGSLALPCYVNTKPLVPGDILMSENEVLAKKKRKLAEEAASQPSEAQVPKGKKAKK